jgi:hypothetical protein
VPDARSLPLNGLKQGTPVAGTQGCIAVVRASRYALRAFLSMREALMAVLKDALWSSS